MQTPTASIMSAFSTKIRLDPDVQTRRIYAILILSVDIIISLTRAVMFMLQGTTAVGLGPIKYIDPLTISILFVLVGSDVWSKRGGIIPRWSGIWWLGFFSVLSWSALNIAIYTPPLGDALQSLFMMLRPFFIFLIFAFLGFTPEDYYRVLKVILLFAITSSLTSVFQYTYNGFTTGDLINGLFHDAHHQATFSYIMVLVLLSAPPDFLKSWMRTGLIIGFIITGFLPVNGKATGILFALLIFAYIYRFLNRQRIIQFLLILPFMTGGLIYTFLSSDELAANIRREITGLLPDVLDRYQTQYYAISFYEDLGIYQMVQYYISEGLKEPSILVSGFGLGNYGSPGLLSRLREGGGRSWQRTFFAFDYYGVSIEDLRLGGLSYKTSLYGTMLGELGLIGMFFFGFLLIGPFLYRMPPGTQLHRQSFWLKIAYIFLLTQALITWSGSWDVDIATYTVMLGLAAHFAESRRLTMQQFETPIPDAIQERLEAST